MKHGLLLIERVIIESLARGPKTIHTIIQDTGLGSSLVTNVLAFMLYKNFIRFNGQSYYIDKETLEDLCNGVESSQSLKKEIKELFDSLVNVFFNTNNKLESTQLKVKKFWLGSGDELVLRSHLRNLEDFFVQLDKRPKVGQERHCLGEKRVFCWGLSDYKTLINECVKI